LDEQAEEGDAVRALHAVLGDVAVVQQVAHCVEEE
jgi:hypothetical protein